MQITVATEGGALCNLEVTLELTLLDLKAILEIELAMSASQMLLYHNSQPMTEDGKNLGEYKIIDGDIIQLAPTQPQATPTQSQATPPMAGPSDPVPNIDWSSVLVPSTGNSNRRVRSAPYRRRDPDDPEEVRRYFLSRPAELEMLRQQNPPLAQALESGDTERFSQMYKRHVQAVRDMERQRIRMLNADPFDPDVQNRIAQEIQQKNIEENMEAAIEYTPESFSNVVMLYVLIKVNGVPVKALVDSGAAGTIMSDTCAERCGVMRLVDRRFAGMAIGVGTQRIIGRVHLGTIQLGEDFLTSSFKVLENQSEDMLLGLDMLRSHQCCIDLKKNVLHIGTTGNEVSFITEAELKDKEETRRRQAQQLMASEDEEMARALAKSDEAQAQSSSNNSTFQAATGSTVATSSSVTMSSSSSPSFQSPPTSVAGGGVAAEGGVAISESAIQQIVTHGFTRDEAIAELRRTGGNWQLALTSLLAKSISL